MGKNPIMVSTKIEDRRATHYVIDGIDFAEAPSLDAVFFATASKSWTSIEHTSAFVPRSA